MTKVCNKCKIEKDKSEFAKTSKKRGSYIGTECRECGANRAKSWRSKNQNRVKGLNLKNSFGITYEEYVKLLEQQNGVCKICGNPEKIKRLGKLKDLSVDHCHKTGKIRGLLCGKCNVGIGHFNDDIYLLMKVIEYLKGQ